MFTAKFSCHSLFHIFENSRQIIDFASRCSPCDFTASRRAPLNSCISYFNLRNSDFNGRRSRALIDRLSVECELITDKFGEATCRLEVLTTACFGEELFKNP